MAEPDPQAPVRRDDHEGEGATRGTARMEAFADGVFAIAFTLPIFNVALPSLQGSGAGFGGRLVEGWPENLNYLLASMVIGLYWVHHHFSGAIYRTTGHYFLLATVLFLTMIGYIAFPVRAFTESLLHAEAVPDSAAFLACSLALTSLTWLLKWTVGNAHGHVDARLDPAYLARLTRRYRAITAWNVTAAVLVWFWWPVGITMAWMGVLAKLLPPETPRYLTQAPAIEGEG
ncbi:TMEM175 family protein [Sphingomonas glaciei]|uniref:TMEM175 family protein n=1 Tax=Sphingomonas glaciei TaxID=2938948 RepID=A0ABY5MZ26_9SPHN|nr:TMEM175 family protein [Sphingomonas glaciei]UUR08719.1 TMEM175 family protein [Sphingomonas glaciei]